MAQVSFSKRLCDRLVYEIGNMDAYSNETSF